MASTNRLEDLDPALLRPGRFGPVIRVLEPEQGQIKAIIDYYARESLYDIWSTLFTIRSRYALETGVLRFILLRDPVITFKNL